MRSKRCWPSIMHLYTPFIRVIFLHRHDKSADFEEQEAKLAAVRYITFSTSVYQRTCFVQNEEARVKAIEDAAAAVMLQTIADGIVSNRVNLIQINHIRC